MRKHFLILMLLALLPLTVGAVQLIKVTPYNVSKYYGQSDESITLIYDLTDPGAPWGTATVYPGTEITHAKDAEILEAGLYISRNGSTNAGEDPNDYTYTLMFSKNRAKAASTAAGWADNVDQFTAFYSVGVLGNAVLSIHKMPLSAADVVVDDIPAQIYDGTAKTPAVTVKNNGKAMVLNTHYTVAYTQNTAKGNAVVTLTGKGDYYTGEKVVNFKINPDFKDATVTLSNVDNLHFNNAVQEPTIQVEFDGGVLTKDVHYTVTYTNSNTGTTDPTKNAGTVTVTVKGIDDAGYTGTITKPYVINPLEVEPTAISVTQGVANPKYNGGQAVNPIITAVSVHALETDFNIDLDHFVAIEAVPSKTIPTTATADGAAEARIKVSGNFTGHKDITYTVDQKDITFVVGTSAKLDQTGATTVNTYTWKNDDIKPTPTLLDGTTKINPSNYTIAWKNLTNEGGDWVVSGDYTKDAGKKRAIITANNTENGGNYDFTAVNLDFEIAKKALTITVNDIEAPVATDINPTLTFEGLVSEGTTPEAETTKGLIEAAAAYEYWTTGSPAVKVTDPIRDAKPGTYTIKLVKKNTTDADGLRTLGLGANYEITFKNGKLTKKAGQVLVKIDNKSIEWGEAKPTTGWTVSYVSGLEDNPTTIVPFIAGLNAAANQANFNLVTPVDGIFDVNTDGYDVTYADGTMSNPNYTVTVQTGKLIVNKKNITTAMIALGDAGDGKAGKYTAAAKSPKVAISYTVKKADGTASGYWTEIPSEYYNTDYDANFNAGTHKAHISCGNDNPYFTAVTNVTYTEAECNTLNAEITGFVAAGAPVGVAATMTATAGYSKDYANGDALLAVDVYKYNTEIGAAKDDSNYKTTSSIKEVLPYAEQEYTISPLKITITADAATWTYGSPESGYTASVSSTVAADNDDQVEPAKLAAFLTGAQVEGFNGTLVVNRVGADNVGTYNNGLQPAIVDADGNGVALGGYGEGFAADNYLITYASGALTINKGEIKVKVSDATLAYKVAPVNNPGTKTYTFNLEPTDGFDIETFKNIVSYSHTPADYGYTAGLENTISNITLNYTGADPSAANYNIVWDNTVDNAVLRVVPRPIKIKVRDLTPVAYSTLATWKTTLAGNNDTKTFNDYVEVVNEEGYYDFVGAGTAQAETFKDVIASVNLESENVGENTVSITALTEGAIAHYVLTLVPGTLNITADASVATFTLNRVLPADYADEYKNTAARIIEQQDGKFVNINFSDFNMIAEKWYPLVLPFATSVREISKVFGYAVVDVFNGTTADGKIQFKLHMGDIAANTPFIVKVYEDQNMSDVSKYYEDAFGGAKVKFANVKIVNAMDVDKEVQVGDATDVEFVGSYKGRTEGFRSNMYYFAEDAKYGQYYKGNDTNKTYLRPLGAYFVDHATNAANTAREILIEEPNGSTTAISAITVDGAFVEADGWYTTNGVKLQGVPTEKGVYIRNGKKIVIK
jgi:hypothetical protein